LLFYEYFHGDNGAGIGASHQTGWTGLVAPLIEIFGHLDTDRRAGSGVSARITPLPKLAAPDFTRLTMPRGKMNHGSLEASGTGRSKWRHTITRSSVP
jgi:hypothetical protein